jgi:hypothetical protein
MRNNCCFRLGVGFLLTALGLGCAFAGSAMATPLSVNHRLLAHSAVDSSLGGNMAGYVLNAETNMNRIYTQKLNQQLLNPTDASYWAYLSTFNPGPSPA